MYRFLYVFCNIQCLKLHGQHIFDMLNIQHASHIRSSAGFTFSHLFARPYFVLAQLLIHIFGHKHGFMQSVPSISTAGFFVIHRITDQAAAGTRTRWHGMMSGEMGLSLLRPPPGRTGAPCHALPQAGQTARRYVVVCRMGLQQQRRTSCRKSDPIGAAAA